MVLEVTTFRLLAGADTEAFLAADKAVQSGSHLASLPPYGSHYLSAVDSGARPRD